MNRHLVVVAIGFLAGAGVAVAGGPPGANIAELLRDEVGLSPEQVDQVRRIHIDERKAAIRRRADVEVARMELRDLLGSETVDTAAVAAKTKQLSDLQAAHLQAKVEAQLAIRKVMSAEQLEKARRLRDEIRPRGARPSDRRRGASDMEDDAER